MFLGVFEPTLKIETNLGVQILSHFLGGSPKCNIHNFSSVFLTAQLDFLFLTYSIFQKSESEPTDLGFFPSIGLS